MVVFDFTRISFNDGPFPTNEELLPRDVKDWLVHRGVFILGSSLTTLLDKPLMGVRVRNFVDSSDIFDRLQAAGVIKPAVDTICGDTSCQATYTFRYHHQPTTETAFKALVGRSMYEKWPPKRSPTWRPCSQIGLKEEDDFARFYIYFETVTPHAFVNLILRQALIYGGISGVEQDAVFPVLYLTFVKQWTKHGNAKAPTGLTVQEFPAALSPGTSSGGVPTTSRSRPAAHVLAVAPSLEVVPEHQVLQIEDPASVQQQRPGGVLKRQRSVKKDSKQRIDLEKWIDDSSDLRTLKYRASSPDRFTVTTPSSPPIRSATATAMAAITSEESGVTPATATISSTSTNLPRPPSPPRGPPRPPSPPRGPPRRTPRPPSPPRGPPGGYHLRQHPERREESDGHHHEASGGAAIFFHGPDDLRTKFAARQMECPSFPEPEEEPASSHLAARQRFLLDHVTLTEEERLANAFLYRPRFEKRCDFCGGRHCSRYAKGTKIINCKKFREQQEFSPNRRICDYRRCSEPQRHHTTVCPTLHRRCTVCRYRGHEKYCDLSNPSVMSVLRADFEAAACHGILTRTRVDDPVWGWYDMPPTAPRNTRFVDYGKITEMDVFEAISFVRSLFADPSVTSGNPADPDHSPSR